MISFLHQIRPSLVVPYHLRLDQFQFDCRSVQFGSLAIRFEDTATIWNHLFQVIEIPFIFVCVNSEQCDLIIHRIGEFLTNKNKIKRNMDSECHCIILNNFCFWKSVHVLPSS